MTLRRFGTLGICGRAFLIGVAFPPVKDVWGSASAGSFLISVTYVQPVAQHAVASAQAMERDTAAGALSLVLLAGFILLLIVLLVTMAVVRSARRRSQATHRQRPAPTQADDVWAMHKLPDETDDHAADLGDDEH